MKPEFFISRRYLSSRHSSFSAELLKWMGLVGVAIGVFALVVVLSVMRGFEGKFEEKILGFQAHVTLEASGEAREALPAPGELERRHEAIVLTERWIEGELVIQSSFGTSSGARIRGIEGDAHAIRGIDRAYFPTVRGERLRAEGEELPGIVLGSELAAALEVHPDFADEVKLVFPFGDLSPTGEVLPRVRRFRVTGIFESGFYEYDHKYAFIDYEMADRLFDEYGREKLALFVRDPLKVGPIKERLVAQEVDPRVSVATWQEQNRPLFSALFLERIGMFILLSMIVLIASFNIFALISIVVLEKVRDMAVLRSMGFKTRSVRSVFLLQSTGIGLKGTCVGGFLGLTVCLWLTWFPYQLPPSYYVEFLPISVEWGPVLLALLTGPVIGFLVGLYPARQATGPNIAEVLRYE